MTSTPRHNLTHPGPWTWTWGSALLLSALLVSPVGADALLHLLQWHGTPPVAVSERERPTVPRRKAEDEPAPPAAQVTSDDAPVLEPDANTAAVVVACPAASASSGVWTIAPASAYGVRPVVVPRSVAFADRPSRAPPV